MASKKELEALRQMMHEHFIRVGRKGAKVRNAHLSAKERKRIAVKAARTRWAKEN